MAYRPGARITVTAGLGTLVRSQLIRVLLRPSRVVLHMVHLGMILDRFKVGRHFARHFQFERHAFFNPRRQTVCFADPHCVWKQQVHLNDLPIACRAKAHPMVLQSDFLAYCIKPVSNLMTNLWIGVIKQPFRRLPD